MPPTRQFSYCSPPLPSPRPVCLPNPSAIVAIIMSMVEVLPPHPSRHPPSLPVPLPNAQKFPSPPVSPTRQFSYRSPPLLSPRPVRLPNPSAVVAVITSVVEVLPPHPSRHLSLSVSPWRDGTGQCGTMRDNAGRYGASGCGNGRAGDGRVRGEDGTGRGRTGWYGTMRYGTGRRGAAMDGTETGG